jgi:hypothetical protein
MDFLRLHKEKGGETPILLDPVDRVIPDLWAIHRIEHNRSPPPFLPEDDGRPILRNVVIFKVLKIFKNFFKKQTMDKV